MIDWMKEAEENEREIIAWRREFHERPELGNKEYRTTETITRILESLGIETRKVLKTGVIGILRGAAES